ncbi:MAG TPA: hypothetical protein VLN74_07110, partial [Ilumatobacteraceae bacterium]|nr:hypothetical protein [Ilumatobacteraceae bacterium]
MRRTALLVLVAVAAAGCSGDAGDPPVVARDVTGITDPVVATTTETTAPVEALEPVEPLEYSIEWTQLTDRTDEGTITVPVDYGDPQGDTIDLYVARHRATADPSA